MADLFADVKVGDAFFTKSIWTGLHKYHVSRVTAMRFYSAKNGNEECVFSKRDGYQIGEGLTRGPRTRALPASDDLIAEYQTKVAISKAKSALHKASDILIKAARDDAEAIRLAALLPPELKGTENG